MQEVEQTSVTARVRRVRCLGIGMLMWKRGAFAFAFVETFVETLARACKTSELALAFAVEAFVVVVVVVFLWFFVVLFAVGFVHRAVVGFVVL